MERGHNPSVHVSRCCVLLSSWADRSRLVFPVRYYIIDFELSVRFPEDSSPDQRVVTGLPLLRLGYDHPDDYGNYIAPEMLLDTPHCPFKSDIFQLGKVFFTHFHASIS
jgi:hypothetical protein